MTETRLKLKKLNSMRLTPDSVHPAQNTSRALIVPDALIQRMNRHLALSGLDNGWLLGVVDLAGTGASGLDSLDNVHGLLVSNLAENDVLAIQPGGDNGGDEELGAVAEMC